MPATLKITHKAIGAEVRRDPYEVVVDGQPVGSFSMNDSFEVALEAGRHTVRLRDGRKSSSTESFDAG